jgi:hypothetical protein
MQIWNVKETSLNYNVISSSSIAFLFLSDYYSYAFYEC